MRGRGRYRVRSAHSRDRLLGAWPINHASSTARAERIVREVKVENAM